MYQVILKKVNSKHNQIRTDEVTGECQFLPEVGKTFVMFAEPLNLEANMRVIQTSKIEQVIGSDTIMTFNTQYSSYELNVISNDLN
jgi:predicted secreted acid phosphatase